MYYLNWIPPDETLVLEEMNQVNPFACRIISKKADKEQKKICPWISNKCPSCCCGLKSKSDPIKCDGCDSYTHPKKSV